MVSAGLAALVAFLFDSNARHREDKDRLQDEKDLLIHRELASNDLAIQKAQRDLEREISDKQAVEHLVKLRAKGKHLTAEEIEKIINSDFRNE